MNIVKSGFVNGKQRYSIINDGDIIKSSYDKHKLQDYLNPPIDPVCDTFEEEDTILDLDNLEDDKLGQGIQAESKDKIKRECFVGDFHFQSSNFDYETFDKWIKEITKNVKSTELAIHLCGDPLDVASLDIGNSAFNTINRTLDQCTDDFVDMMKPVQKSIRGSVYSNHMVRLLSKFNYDLDRVLCEKLGCSNQGAIGKDIIDTPIGQYKVRYQHGTGSSKNERLLISKVEREFEDISGEIFGMGHIHKSTFHSKLYHGHIKPRKMYYVTIPSFLKYQGSYGEREGYKMLPSGYNYINFTKSYGLQFVEKLYNNDGDLIL